MVLAKESIWWVASIAELCQEKLYVMQCNAIIIIIVIILIEISLTVCSNLNAISRRHRQLFFFFPGVCPCFPPYLYILLQHIMYFHFHAANVSLGGSDSRKEVRN